MTAKVTDIAGNASATSPATSVTVDTVAPTLSVDIADGSLSDGDASSVVAFTFSEAPVGFTAGDIDAVGGVVTGLSATGDPLVYTATFTADDGFTGTGSVTVAAGGYTDAALNLGGAGSDNVTIDTTMAPPPTKLTFHMSGDFVTDVTGLPEGQTGSNYTGAWVYLYNSHPPAGEKSNFTTLIDGGQLQPVVRPDGSGNYTVAIDLTNATTTTVNGGVLYLLVQSEALTGPGSPAHAHDLTTLITSETLIAINVGNWQYGYSQFEYSLLGKGGDAGDMTAIPGFAQNTQLHVHYSDGTDQYRGYGQTQSTTVTALNNNSVTTPNVLKYAAGQLGGETMMVISPSNIQMGGGALYPVSDWTDYVTQGFASQYDLLLSGSTNGEVDANGVWHNGQYYSYNIQSVQLNAGTWGNAGQYFVFSPKEGSQTQAWMVISEADLQLNLYSAGQGKLYIYEDPYLTQPYTVPGSGSPPGSPDATFVTPGGTNDEFGNVLTQAFTGFTAGYWATVANQSNPYNGGTYRPNNWAAQTINLNDNTNWDAAYAFDNFRDTTVSPKPAYIHYDAYSEYFFYHSNVYGSAFSDNLSVDVTPGPLIPLGQPGSTGTSPSNNVGNIDFYVYGSTEVAPNYTAPTGGPFLAPQTSQTDYLIPNTAAALSLNVVGRDGSALLRSDINVQLGIYIGKDANGHGQFDYVTLPTGGNIWQTYTFAGSPGAWTVTASSNVTGTFGIAGLPVASTVAQGDVGWYQLVLSDTSGHQKVYEFYTTAASTTPGDIESTIFDVAVAGGANINPNTLSANFLEIDLIEYKTAPVEMLTFAYAGGASLNQAAAAPIAGTLSGAVFTALDYQNGTGMPSQGNVPVSAAPSLSITGSLRPTPLAFGWTGTNNGTNTGTPTNSVVNSFGAIATWGLTSQYTNQIVPGHIAQVVITQTGPDATFSSVLQATPDLDGRWQTTTTSTLGNGTYSVTLQELLADGVTPYGPPSVPLTLTVTGVAATGAVSDTAANISADLDTYGANPPTSVTVSDNEALTVTVGQITGDAGALAKTQNADTSPYKLIVQDKAGNVAAAIDALAANSHVKQIAFTDAGTSTIAITHAQYLADGAAIDKMTGARDILMSVTGQAYSSMEYAYNDRDELTGVTHFHTGVTGHAYTGYETHLDGSNRLMSHYFTGVSGQAYYAYEYDYAAGYAGGLPHHGLIGQKYFFANVQDQPITNYQHDLDASGQTTRLYYSGVKTQPYSSYENDYIINSTGSHFAGQKYYTTDIVGRNYTGHEQDLDTSSKLIKEVFTGAQITSTQVYSSWENEYADGNGVLTGQKYYQSDINGQDYTGYVVELDAAGKKIGETWTGVTGQSYTAYEYEYANGDGVVTGITHYFTNVQNKEYASYQLDYDVSGTTSTEAQVIYNMNDGSHTIKGLLSTPQTLHSIFDDVMTGGSGADSFVYAPLFGTSIITDFTSADVTISLPSSEFANYAYLQGNSAVIGDNTVIMGTNGDTLTLQGVNALPDQSDFLFV